MHSPLILAAYAVSFILFYYSNLALADLILDKPRFKKVGRLVICLVITATYVYLVFCKEGDQQNTVQMALVSYLFYPVLLFVLYKNMFDSIFILSLPCAVFYFVSRVVVISSTALWLDQGLYEITNNKALLAWNLIGSLVLASLLLQIFARKMPTNVHYILNKRISEIFQFTIWFFFAVIFWFINQLFYTNPDIDFVVAVNQLAIATILSSAGFIVFKMAIHSNEVQYYQTKSNDFRMLADQEKFFRAVILVDTIASYECNCTKDTFRMFGDTTSVKLDPKMSCTQMIEYIATNVVHPDDSQDFRNAASPENILQAYENGIQEVILEYRSNAIDSNYTWFRIIINSMLNEKSNDIQAFAYIKNIDNFKKQQLELKHKAERDYLTGVYNKTTAEDLVKVKIINQRAGVLFIIDIDNFKAVNDTFGHPFGDEVIVEAANIIQSLFRDEDIVGRIGGDEFMVFMQTKNLEQATMKAEALCEMLSITYEGRVSISASIGMAIFPEHGDRFANIYKNADLALYTSKRKGKNIYTIYSGEKYINYENNRTAIESEINKV